METTTYPYPLSTQHPPPANQKRRQGGGGALWGFVFGMLGGAGSAVILAGVLAASTLLKSGNFEDGAGIFILFALFGGFVGAIVGGVVGVVAGLLLGLGRLERFACWVTAALCATPPVITTIAIAEDAQSLYVDIGAGLITTGLFAIVGYYTGKAFEVRLSEDAELASTR